MANVLAAVNNCFSYAGSFRRRVIDKWHAVDGKINQDAFGQFGFPINLDALARFGPPKSSEWRIKPDGVYRGDAKLLKVDRARGFASYIDSVYVGADHRDVWKSQIWTEIYQSRNHNMSFMNSTGNVVGKQVQTTPCHNCGILLPRDCIQVDHYAPQTGGEDLYTIKMLRSLGLTRLGPTGGKGSTDLTATALKLYPDLRERGTTSYKHFDTPTPGGKWSTNDEGTAFLSLLASREKLDELRTACKNSLLNLVPLCGSCNRVKTNRVRKIE